MARALTLPATPGQPHRPPGWKDGEGAPASGKVTK
jgi:hypothetical protein